MRWQGTTPAPRPNGKGEKAASAVPSILKEGKGGKLVKTPTQPCCKQRNLFCNAAALPGSHAHQRARPAGAEPRQPGWATLSCPIPSRPIPSRPVPSHPITQRHGGSVGALGQRLPLPGCQEERWLLGDPLAASPRCLLAKQPPKGASPRHFNFLLSFEMITAGAGGLVHSPFKHLSAQLIPAPF